MGGVLGSCVGSFAATCGCAAFNSCCSKGGDPRIPYLAIVFLLVLISGILRYWGGPINVHLYYWDIGCSSPKCYGDGAVYRIMLAQFLFFGFFGLVMQMKSCVRSGLNEGYWIIKVLLLVALIVISYFLPNQVIDAFRYTSMVVSALYTLVQVVLLVDFAYNWNESWLEKDMKVSMLVCALLCYLVSLAAVVLLFHFYAHGDDCHQPKTFISVTIIWSLVYSLLSITDYAEHGALLPSACVTVYCYWVLYTALANTAEPCNQLKPDADDAFTVISGFVMLAASIVYGGWNVSKKTADGALSTQGDTYDALESQDVRTDDDEGDEIEEESNGAVGAIRSSSGFHFTMAAASCYATMLLTQWGEGTDSENVTQAATTTMWIKMVSQWCCMFMYTWSLLAPYCLGGYRDFD